MPSSGPVVSKKVVQLSLKWKADVAQKGPNRDNLHLEVVVVNNQEEVK